MRWRNERCGRTPWHRRGVRRAVQPASLETRPTVGGGGTETMLWRHQHEAQLMPTVTPVRSEIK